MPTPADPPVSWLAFMKLFDLDDKQLRELGLGCWDGGLYLFPVEWYDSIPNGFPVETIRGNIEKFRRGKTSADRGFGCLAYGVRIGPPEDESESR